MWFATDGLPTHASSTLAGQLGLPAIDAGAMIGFHETYAVTGLCVVHPLKS
jgi:hypothetical protein